jgi:hypothetical protein
LLPAFGRKNNPKSYKAKEVGKSNMWNRQQSGKKVQIMVKWFNLR